MKELKILYSEELEVKRIVNTLSKREWYREHKYSILLPEGINVNNVKEVIAQNFKKEDYENARQKLLGEFDQDLFKKLEMKIGKKFSEEIIVILTQYGTGGSYNPPNKVIINFRKNKNLLNCLKHELIHLLIEEEVQKRGLTQEEKEKMVDDLMEIGLQ